mmetsp:Transcript_4613/g.6801  ORF Transcript_4613/g.6801 Transcript_4613/m.6801 type:complete len:97 (+) Transcript_4613:27-317(+)
MPKTTPTNEEIISVSQIFEMITNMRSEIETLNNDVGTLKNDMQIVKNEIKTINARAAKVNMLFANDRVALMNKANKGTYMPLKPFYVVKDDHVLEE